MKLKLIYARAANGVIGANQQLPWHLPEDLAHFKKHTLGNPVLMGRKTWEALPAKFRPLPGRPNLVLTRQKNWHAEGAHRVSTIEEGMALALALSAPGSDLWIIGGAELYAQTQAVADEALVTEIEQDFEGDAFAPTLGPDWQEHSRQAHTSASGLRFNFVHYVNQRLQHASSPT